ncbi:MAG: hypothetical protein ACYTXA_02625 [Nostoc sp.]
MRAVGVGVGVGVGEASRREASLREASGREASRREAFPQVSPYYENISMFFTLLNLL